MKSISYHPHDPRNTGSPTPLPPTRLSFIFNEILHPYGKDAPGKIGIDTIERYGYWEHADGSEGGGLWFDFIENKEEGFELVDYDGAAVLPRKIIEALRAADIEVDPEYF